MLVFSKPCLGAQITKNDFSMLVMSYFTSLLSKTSPVFLSMYLKFYQHTRDHYYYKFILNHIEHILNLFLVQWCFNSFIYNIFLGWCSPINEGSIYFFFTVTQWTTWDFFRTKAFIHSGHGIFFNTTNINYFYFIKTFQDLFLFL